MDEDPAEFLLSNSKYHDCYVVVGDPLSEKTERIGVSSTHLIASSPVFREMFESSKQNDTSGANIHIKDVSPATFKLGLRHVYGGNLSKLDFEERKNVAKFGSKYKIYHLVNEVGKQIELVSAEDIFQALVFSAHFNCPTLELEVRKIFQELTFSLLREKHFLDLDEDSLEMIVKQDTLSVTELELWPHLVSWGEHQIKKHPEKSLRDCLNKVLMHFRVLTLSFDEIVKHVLPTGVLTHEELVDLTCALAENKPLQSPGLCKNNEERKRYFNNTGCFEVEGKRGTGNHNLCLQKLSGKQCSTFSIRQKYDRLVVIDSIIIKNQEWEPNSQYKHVYDLQCHIEVTKSVDGFSVERHDFWVMCSDVVFNDNIRMPIKLKDEKPLVLKGIGKFTFNLKFNTPHTVYEIFRKHLQLNDAKLVDVTFDEFTFHNGTIRYDDHPHVIGISYRY